MQSILNLHSGDFVWINDPVSIERLALIVTIPRTGEFLIRRQMRGRWSSFRNGWGPLQQISIADIIRLESRTDPRPEC